MGDVGGVSGEGGGNEERTTNGAVRYSIPMLREDREIFKISFIKLYRVAAVRTIRRK